MNRIPFNLTVNATVRGSLNRFAFKWYDFDDARKNIWLVNFKPVYDKYLRENKYKKSIQNLHFMLWN